MDAISLDTGGAPLELVTQIQAIHKGLRIVELLQLQGPKSYQAINLQWALKHDGRLVEEDDIPDDSAEEIVKTIWTAAASHHQSKRGDQRFSCKVHRFIGGKLKIEDIKFSVSPIDDVEAPSGRRLEEAESSFIKSIVSYVDQLHMLSIKKEEAHVRAWEASASRDLRTTETMASVMQAAMAIRMEAFEERADAILERAGGGTKSEGIKWEDQWAGARKTMTDLLNSPIGAAFAAKFAGLPADQLMALLNPEGSKPPASENKAPTISDIRPFLRELGATITTKQQGEIASVIGVKLGLQLKSAGQATSPEDAHRLTIEVMNGIGAENKWDPFQRIFDDKQQSIVKRIFDSLDFGGPQ
jgi:hypothetical protein